MLSQITLFLVFLTTFGNANLIPCDLKWVPQGYGNVPEKSVSVQDEYIIRIHRSNEWLGGRLNFGKAVVIQNSVVIQTNTYEVLTNPKNCQLFWIPGPYGASEVQGSISFENYRMEKTNGRFIGKSSEHGFPGQIIPSANIFQFVDANKRPRESSQYEILISVYPTLHLSLSDVSFDLQNLKYISSKTELIGQNGFQNSIHGDAHHRIVHEKNVTEKFFITLDQGFSGISNVSLNFQLWYASPDVQEELCVVENQRHITIHRIRTIKVISDVNLPSALDGTQQHFEVTTYGKIQNIQAQSELLSFEADGSFWNDDLSRADLEYVVEKLGFELLSSELQMESNTVRTKVTGQFGGRFLTSFVTDSKEI